MASLSEYNQILDEERTISQFKEFVDVFGQVVNSKHFANTSIVLFLNKKDIFQEKLARFPLCDWVDGYAGENSQEACAQFIQGKYFEQITRKVYLHKTCATDTQSTNATLKACFDTILAKNIAMVCVKLS